MKLVEFSMLEEECLSGNFTDSISSALLGELQTSGVKCLPGNGIKLSEDADADARGIVSTLPVQGLKGAISAGGGNFSMEMWVERGGMRTNNQILFSLDYWSGNRYKFDTYLADRTYTQDTDLRVAVSSKSSGMTKEMDFVSRETETDTLLNRTHVVVTVADNKFKLYVDGEFVAPDGVNNDVTSFPFSSWSDDGVMRLLHNADPDQTYTGTHLGLFYYSVWAPALDANETLARHHGGPPNARPLALDVSASMQQNGEVGTHADDPAFYSMPIPSAQLATITLLPYDYDDDDYDNLDVGEGVRVHIASLPRSGGSLYLYDGTEIAAVPTEVPRNRSSGEFSVRFRPRWNVYSDNSTHVLDTFTYRAEDGRVPGLYSINNGTVSITVSRVNQPPVPSTNTTATVLAQRLEVLPSISGIDADGTVDGAVIVSLPRNGTLHEVHANGSMSTAPLRNGSALSGFSVAYLYTGREDVLIAVADDDDDSADVVGRDEFAFAVIDDGGLTSVSATYSVIALASVQATASAARNSDDALVAVEDEASLVAVTGVDLSDAARELWVRVEALPGRGYLYDPTDTAMTPLAVGDCLASSIASADYAAGTTIGYMSPPRFFTWPSLAWNGSTVSAAVGGGSYDSFQFSVVTSSSSSSSSSGAYSAISSSTTQYVAVLNKNEPTEVEYGSGNEEEEEQITIRPIAFGSDNVAIVSRFTIWDPDCDTDLVRVQLVSERGARMTLNKNHIDALHFISPTYCYGNLRWQCKGSGYYEDEMSFVGTPRQVSAALNGLRYESSKAEAVDTVTVSIHDGAGGHCLDASLQSASRRDGCYTRNTSFAVRVLGYEHDTDDSVADGDSPLGALPARTVLFAMLAICICCTCASVRLLARCMRKRCCCREKDEEKLSVDEDSSSSSGCGSGGGGGGGGKARRKHGDNAGSHGGNYGRTESTATLELADIYPAEVEHCPQGDVAWYTAPVPESTRSRAIATGAEYSSSSSIIKRQSSEDNGDSDGGGQQQQQQLLYPIGWPEERHTANHSMDADGHYRCASPMQPGECPAEWPHHFSAV